MKRLDKIISYCINHFEDNDKLEKGLNIIEDIIINYSEEDDLLNYNLLNLIRRMQNSIDYLNKHKKDSIHNTSYYKTIYQIRKMLDSLTNHINDVLKDTYKISNIFNMYQLITLIDVDLNMIKDICETNNFKYTIENCIINNYTVGVRCLISDETYSLTYIFDQIKTHSLIIKLIKKIIK